MGANHQFVVTPARWLREGRWQDDDVGFAHLTGSQHSAVASAFDELKALSEPTPPERSVVGAVSDGLFSNVEAGVKADAKGITLDNRDGKLAKPSEAATLEVFIGYEGEPPILAHAEGPENTRLGSADYQRHGGNHRHRSGLAAGGC